MKIGIVGGGATGLLVAALLKLGNHEVTVYVRRKEQKELLLKKGLYFENTGKSIKISAELFERSARMDLLVVCVKQHQLQNIYPFLEKNGSPLLFLQNGFGHAEVLKELAYSVPVMLGIIEHGAIRTADNRVKHTGKGRIRVAGFNKTGIEVISSVQSLENRHFPVVLEEDWNKMLLDKLVINSVINPLTALFDVDNGEILSNSQLFSIASTLTEEICTILNLNFAFYWERIKRICKETSSNTSSMRSDIKAGQKTEIENLSGYLLGKTENQERGYLHFTYHAIQALEQKGKNNGN